MADVRRDIKAKGLTAHTDQAQDAAKKAAPSARDTAASPDSSASKRDSASEGSSASSSEGAVKELTEINATLKEMKSADKTGPMSRDDAGKPEASVAKRDDAGKPEASVAKRDDAGKPEASVAKRDDAGKPEASREEGEDKPEEESMGRKLFNHTPLGMVANAIGGLFGGDDKKKKDKKKQPTRDDATAGKKDGTAQPEENKGEDDAERSMLGQLYDKTPLGMVTNAIGGLFGGDDKKKAPKAAAAPTRDTAIEGGKKPEDAKEGDKEKEAKRGEEEAPAESKGILQTVAEATPVGMAAKAIGGLFGGDDKPAEKNAREGAIDRNKPMPVTVVKGGLQADDQKDASRAGESSSPGILGGASKAVGGVIEAVGGVVGKGISAVGDFFFGDRSKKSEDKLTDGGTPQEAATTVGADGNVSPVTGGSSLGDIMRRGMLSGNQKDMKLKGTADLKINGMPVGQIDLDLRAD